MATTTNTATEWIPTHVITTDDGTETAVMLIDTGAAYTLAEWEAEANADYERNAAGEWTFLGEPFAGTVTRIDAREIKTAKPYTAFSDGSTTNCFRFDEDGTVRAFDDVAGHFTARHSLTDLQMGMIRCEWQHSIAALGR